MTLRRAFQLGVMFLCVVYIGFVAISRAENVPYDGDEISWYFHTKFFDEAFIKKNIRSPLWAGYESFDHPPFSKYIFGAYLYMYDHDYASKRDALEKKYGRWDFYYTINGYKSIPNTEFGPILYALRKVNIVCILLILGELFVICYMVSQSVILSLVLCLIVAGNSLFTDSLAIITSDSHTLFFSLLAIILYFRSLKSKQWWWIAGASVSTACAIGSKLTGIFIFCSVLGTEMMRVMYKDIPYVKIMKRIAVYGLGSYLMWYLINPALYFSPVINTVKYFTFRTSESSIIAHSLPGEALNTVSDRLQAIVCTVLVPCNLQLTEGRGILSSSGVFNITLFGLGLWYCLLEVRKKRADIMFLILLIYINCVIYIFSLSNYSRRYYVPLQVIIFIIQLLGGMSLMKFLWKKFFSKRRQ